MGNSSSIDTSFGEIQISNVPRVNFEKSQLTGEVRINLTKPFPTDTLHVILKGIEKVKIATTGCDNKKLTHFLKSSLKEEKEVFNSHVKINLGERPLSIGLHTYAFIINLPEGIPPSFSYRFFEYSEKCYGRVEYKLIAALQSDDQRTGLFEEINVNIVSNKPFDVNNNIDVLKKQAVRNDFFCELEIDEINFFTEDSIKAGIKINNPKGYTEILGIEVKLFVITVLKAETSVKTVKHLLTKKNLEGVKPGFMFVKSLEINLEEPKRLNYQNCFSYNGKLIQNYFILQFLFTTPKFILFKKETKIDFLVKVVRDKQLKGQYEELSNIQIGVGKRRKTKAEKVFEQKLVENIKRKTEAGGIDKERVKKAKEMLFSPKQKSQKTISKESSVDENDRYIDSDLSEPFSNEDKKNVYMVQDPLLSPKYKHKEPKTNYTSTAEIHNPFNNPEKDKYRHLSFNKPIPQEIEQVRKAFPEASNEQSIFGVEDKSITYLPTNSVSRVKPEKTDEESQIHNRSRGFDTFASKTYENPFQTKQGLQTGQYRHLSITKKQSLKIVVPEETISEQSEESELEDVAESYKPKTKNIDIVDMSNDYQMESQFIIRNEGKNRRSTIIMKKASNIKEIPTPILKTPTDKKIPDTSLYKPNTSKNKLIISSYNSFMYPTILN